MIGFLVFVAVVLIAAWPYYEEARRKPVNAAMRRSAKGGRFAKLPSGTTHYQWIGPARGPVAVCIHGLTTPAFVWAPIAKELGRQGFRVLIYDLYGRGLSDRPQGRQDRAHFLRQLTELLDHEELGDDLTLFGYSMGGSIVTAFAAAHPGRVRQVVLLASAGVLGNPPPLYGFVRRVPVLGDWLFMAAFPRKFRRDTEAERDLDSALPGIVDMQQGELEKKGFVTAVLSSLRGMLSETLERDHRALHEAGVPVLAIWGEEDALIPISAMGKLAEWNRSAAQESVPGAGHGLPYTHPQAVARIFEDLVEHPVA